MAHAHGEAFCLMWYACPCGHRERIWNSRDGVTPFGGLRCPSCNSTTASAPLPGTLGDAATRAAGRPMPTGMQHVDWQLDQRAPDHKLAPGQRFWRDGTADEAVAIIERRIALFAARGLAVPDDVAQGLRAAARAQRDEFRPGWPMIDRAPDR